MLEFNVPGKAQIRRFIIELDQGLVKLVCDGKAIDPVNVLDIETKKADALLFAMGDVAVDILEAEEVIKTKEEFVTDIKEAAETYKIATALPKPKE